MTVKVMGLARRQTCWPCFASGMEARQGGDALPAQAPYDSGDTKHDQGINKASNTRARAIAVQMAWLWLRYQLKSELSLWYYRRVGDLKGRVRRTMIIALARKLVIALWRYVETGKVPTGAIVTA
jgi:transposase